MKGKAESSRKPFAKRSLGQNFLVDKKVIRKIIDSVGEIGSSHIIEIGPGRGALTDYLAKKAGILTAVEMDTEFASALATQYLGKHHVRILEMDILSSDICEIAGWGGLDNVQIVANLPYNISTPVLRLLSASISCFSAAVLMLQKEVVERISAKPGNRNRGYLTVLTEVYFDTELLFEVPPTAFKPAPKVRSAVLRLVPKKNQINISSDKFKKVVSAGFAQKRKTIANNLKQIRGITDAKGLLVSLGLDPDLRPEALELNDWLLLANELSEV